MINTDYWLGLMRRLADEVRSDRPYKKALSHGNTLEVITVSDGCTMPSHFDPDVLEAFRRCAGRFRDIFESITD
jgi:putative two-component system response regulator